MGTSQAKKDPNIDIHIEVSRIVYLPGQIVQGNIYLNVKTYSQYDGQQHCLWHQGQGKDRRRYENTKKNYEYQFPITNFRGNAVPGQFTFPFTFVLPNQMSGSFYFSEKNYVQYFLKAYLCCLSKKNDNQIAKINMNIREPLRAQFGPIKQTQITNGKCCGCCADYGKTQITIQCDRNFVRTDEQILVKTLINNGGGTKELQNVNLVLRLNKMMISNSGRCTMRDSQVFTLASLNKVISPGQMQTHTLQPRIPNNLVRETAIGSITALWYQIAVTTEQGCCNYSPPTAKLHVILHSNNPILRINQKINPPQFWSPIISPTLAYQSMQPFIYTPHQKLRNLNLRNIALVNQAFEQGYRPNFDQNTYSNNLQNGNTNRQIYQKNQNFYQADQKYQQKRYDYGN